jgi:hypothetical protein
LIAATVAAFAPGLAPSGYHSARVRVADAHSAASISDAIVNVNGTALAYVPGRAQYEGSVEVAPGASVALSVAQGGSTYGASLAQFPAYCTLTTPEPGSVLHDGVSSEVRWANNGSAGAPFGVGLLDETNINGPLIWPANGELAPAATPTNAEIQLQLPGAMRELVVEQSAATSIARADPGSTLVVRAVCGSKVVVDDAPLASVSVEPSTLSIPLAVTPQGPLRAVGMFSDGTTMDLTDQVTWQSSPAAVVQVDGEGNVQTGQVGSTIVTATYGALVGSASVTVGPPVLISLAIEPSTLSIPLANGPQGPLHAIGTYSDGTTVDLTDQVSWQSSAVVVVDVDASGYLRTGMGGQATITATYGTFTATSTVTVGPPVPVGLVIYPNNPPPVVERGGTLQLQALLVYSDSRSYDETQGCFWESSNLAVATVSNGSEPRGQVTGVDAGTAVISATLPPFTSMQAVEVSN